MRLAPAIKEAILRAPGGARAYLERLVTEDQTGTGKATRKEAERLQRKLENAEKTLKSKEKLIQDAEKHRRAYLDIKADLKMRETENRRFKSLLYLAKSRTRLFVMALLKVAHAHESDFDLEMMQLAISMTLGQANDVDTDPPATAAEKKLIGADIGVENQ